MASESSGPGPLAPPPGSSDTSTLAPNIVAAWVIMTVLSTTTVSLRFYTRRVILRVLGVEDWLILFAMVLSLGTCIGFIRQTLFALGRHIWTLTPENMIQWQKESWYSFVFYTNALAFTKLSILVLYMRILVHGPARIANYIVLGIVVICNTWVFINSFISCIPLEAYWDPAVPGKCLGLSVALGNSILHIITDFMIFLLPLPVLARLNMHRKQKRALMGVFSLGFVVCIISIIRIVTISYSDFADLTYQFSVLAYWGAVEVNLAIICACLTTLKPLLVTLSPRLLGSTITNWSNGAPQSSAYRRVRAPMSQQTTSKAVMEEENGFARFEDVYNRSETGSTTSPRYDMEGNGRRNSYVPSMTVPSKAHLTLGMR